MKKLRVSVDIENDKDVQSVLRNIQGFLVDAPVEITFRFEVADEEGQVWIPVK